MNVKVQIDGKVYEVEVGDLNARPVIAVVEGEPFAVWLSTDDEADKRIEADSATTAKIQTPTSNVQRPASNMQPPVSNLQSPTSNAIPAPIPGVIVSVAVQPGDSVGVGQELCVLEAMKMKNVIRAARAGTIGAVRAQVGQTVKHRDVLMEYA
ncbi:MAG TPA: biotin/lipoyl-containing protein [Anaerolineales bacterium]|nr:biotin/lipoyl-containing protein [Anaerolineales bacterium]